MEDYHVARHIALAEPKVCAAACNPYHLQMRREMNNVRDDVTQKCELMGRAILAKLSEYGTFLAMPQEHRP